MDYIGIDPASESFTAARYPGRSTRSFANTAEGIQAFVHWLQEQPRSAEEVRICIENTGVYAEVLCYQLHEMGFALSLLDPRKVWKAFPDGQPKSDPLDSRKIA